MKLYYFLYHMPYPRKWSMEKRNIFREIPTKYTAVKDHVH